MAKKKKSVSEYITKELVLFAREFSKSYRTISPGKYISNGNTYVIHYIKTSGKNCPIRVGMNSGIIEMGQKELLDKQHYAEDYIFFMIIWCVIEHNTNNCLKSDRIAVETVNGVKGESILRGHLKLLSTSMDAANIKRIVQLHKILWKKKVMRAILSDSQLVTSYLTGVQKFGHKN